MLELNNSLLLFLNNYYLYFHKY